MYTIKDTIVAIATPPGVGGVAIVRVSGEKENVELIISTLLHKSLKSRLATLCNVYDEEGVVIDQAIGIYFSSPNSYTGQSVLEIHGHGNPILVEMILNRILSIGARIANPGEFTLRAFLNGKIDLTQAEAVADLINSQSELELRASFKGLVGEFSNQIKLYSSVIKELRIIFEAYLDFPEENIFFEYKEIVKLEKVIGHIDCLISQGKYVLKEREGFSIAILGRPNVGKSSLFNYLCPQSDVIVTEIEGTTRDIIRDRIYIHGKPINFFDTAGFRETTDKIELIGQEKTRSILDKIDRVFFLIDASKKISLENNKLISEIEKKLPVDIIFNKVDLVENFELPNFDNNKKYFCVSVKTGEGIEKIYSYLEYLLLSQSENVLPWLRIRHIDSLICCLDHLKKAYDLWKNKICDELIAEEFALAERSLACVIGDVTNEDLLESIFNKFCIGK